MNKEEQKLALKIERLEKELSQEREKKKGYARQVKALSKKLQVNQKSKKELQVRLREELKKND